MKEKISLFYCPINTIDAVPQENIYLSDFYLDIKNCRWKEQVDKYRTTQDKNIKRALPKVTGCGTFRIKNENGIETFSNRIFIDIDDVSDLSIKNELIKDEFIEAISLSCSGTRLFCVIKIPSPENGKELKEFYTEYFQAIESYFKNRYSINIDSSCKDVSRFRFVTYDPEIYFDFSKQTFNLSKGINHSLIAISCKMIRECEKDKHYNLLKASRLAGGFIAGGHLIESFAFESLKDEISKKNIDSLDAAIKTIRAGISNGKLTPIKDVSKYEVEKIETFWTVIESKNSKKIKINKYELMNFLTDNGFFNYQLGKESVIQIKITDNIVDNVDLDKIRQFILMFLEGLPDYFDDIKREQLIEVYLNSIKEIINKDLIGIMRNISIDFLRDTPNEAYLFFKNGVVTISKDEIKTTPFKMMKKYIWRDRIIQREFHKIDQGKIIDSEFMRMIAIISGCKTLEPEIAQQNFDSFATSIGYILHNYKDPIFSPCLILTDSIVSDGANGGVGKGILINGIKYLKNTATYDGKGFDFSKGFVWQRVNPDTELIAIEDIKKDYNFESMFSIITEGITVEKKNKNEFYLPFEKSPKFILTTNYALKGNGSSFERRKIELELSNYFNEKITPFDEFGRRLFHDWSEKDWSLFDNFMLTCIAAYLKNGVLRQSNSNIKIKKIINDTSREFADFFPKNYTLNDEFSVEDNKLLFIENYPEFEDLTNKKYVLWIKRYCVNVSLKYSSRRVMGRNLATIKETQKNNTDLSVLNTF